MKKEDFKAIGTIFLILAVATGLALAGSWNGATIFDNFPIFAFLIIIAFVIQWVAFIPAYIKQTEIFYDLVGSITNSTLIILAVVLSPDITIRSIILLIIILIWAGRL